MRLGIVVGTNESEVVWNALRLGVTALKANHDVNIFLINKGVEIDESAFNEAKKQHQLKS